MNRINKNNKQNQVRSLNLKEEIQEKSASDKLLCRMLVSFDLDYGVML